MNWLCSLTDMMCNYPSRRLNFHGLISILGYSCPQGLDVLCVWFVMKMDVYRWGWRCRGQTDRQVIRADSHRETLSSRSIFETEDPGSQYCLTGTESEIIRTQELCHAERLHYLVPQRDVRVLTFSLFAWLLCFVHDLFIVSQHLRWRPAAVRTTAVETWPQVGRTRKMCSKPDKTRLSLLYHNARLVSGAHLANCSTVPVMGAVCLGGKTVGAWNWALTSYQVRRLRTCGVILPLPLSICGHGVHRGKCNFTFLYFTILTWNS